MTEDIRWKQRFSNYLKALQTLGRGIDLAKQRALSELEQQGLVQGFEFTHELAWNVLKDYLEDMGVFNLVGSKDATRAAFRIGLIVDGEAWMDMIKARNLSSHTYNQETAEEIVENVLTRFYPAFEQLKETFLRIEQEVGEK